MHYPTETLSLSNYAAYFLLLFYIPFHRLISFAITYIFALQLPTFLFYNKQDGRIEESMEWYLKTIKSSCEESCIKAKYIFDKVVKFISHGSSSPFCLRCHYKTQRGILLAKIKK